MRRIHALILTLAVASVCSASAAAVQDQSRPVILNATMDVSGEHLIVMGSGFGTAPVVTIDGQPVTVLPGATDTQVTVLTPAALLTTAGTYRLTVVDSARSVSGSFVVASRAGLVPAAGTTSGAVLSGQPLASAGETIAGDTAAPITPQAVIEDSTSPYRTAIGASALANNTGTGLGNTAAGHYTLYSNTTGGLNTGVGAWSLYSSTTGNYNTAAGYTSLWSNTSGSYNTAFGNMSLYQNTIGQANTAVGSEALITATSATSNTAVGISALRSTSGSSNTGVGAFAGYYATSGQYNVFLGAGARGTATDTNTIRIGVPYDGSIGQNRTFIAGIRGQSVSSALPVVIDANGQLGTADNSGNFGIGTASPVARLQVEGGETRLQNSNGTYTHFNHAGSSVNYVRGTTYFDSAPAYFTGGNIGIGTTSPVARLQVEGGETRLQNSNGTYTHFNYAGSSVNYVRGTTYFDSAPAYFTGGNIGIGTTTPAYPLHMGSGAYVSAGGVWTNASSRTLKQDIAELPLDRALAALEGLAPVTFAYKASPDERHVGFIAEDVPELVAPADRTGLSPMDIVAVLTKVVQAQQGTIQELQARIAELQEQVTGHKKAR